MQRSGLLAPEACSAPFFDKSLTHLETEKGSLITLAMEIPTMRYSRRITAALLPLLFATPTLTIAQSDPPATPVIVHSKFGGQIFGFDIDQNGTEGVLSEALSQSNGNILAAVETFDQKTGKILNVLAKTQTQDDFVTLGVTGTSVGLIEHEHVIKLLDVVRTFQVINPLSGNKITGKWTPPLGTTHLLDQVSNTPVSYTHLTLPTNREV